MENQSTETLIVSSDNGHEHLFTSSSSSSSLVSCDSSSSNLHKIDISHGIDSVKLEELLKHAHTSLGDEHYDNKPDHYHGIKHNAQTDLNLPEQVDQIYEATKLHSFGRDNDDVRDYPQHHLKYDGSIGGSTRSAITTSGSSLGSLSSGNYESVYPPFYPGHYSEGENHDHQNQPILTISHQHEQNYSRLPKMSRPVRVTLSASNKNYQAARYKTELCLHFREHNTCPHGDMCLFAHGLSELRPYRGRHPKHKTQPCRSFHQTGFCNYGYRCSYIHLESPETIKYLRGLNINKAQEEGCTNTKPVKCEIGLNSRDRVQFKHK